MKPQRLAKVRVKNIYNESGLKFRFIPATKGKGLSHYRDSKH